ncbi:pyridoxal phosphate-dependent aminotransferase [Clostridium tarantellae]|uniref:Aminotransferase n=1 Tax=Clostridium tarantellae TaxID=39493 RepID=A0A6I1MKX9_9CLOT|nr:pyridoxal phosphate-dependent aminotransferase [Clostridium tarantellae]MPQ43680.1 aminotransferase class I/II-fold pyridoxal phosphate-dependent enzyme [Clostridium tarantellae]
MNLSKKALNVEQSLTLALTAKAAELKENGVDVISFGVGEPDFNTPQNIINAAVKAMEDGKTKYTAASGIVELKNAIIKKLKKDNNLEYKINNIVISTGAKQCLANIFTALLNPGDEVMIPTPYWVSYPELIKLNDGVSVIIETSEVNDFKVTVDELAKNLTVKSKAILINSPNNPTGSIYSKEELEKIAKFAKENNLYIISDEIYEKLIYDNNKHISIASINEDAYNRTIVINGFSKSYAMTGWRIGYTASNEKISKLMSSIQSHTTSNVNTIAQYAAVEALEGSQEQLDSMIKEFSKRRNIMLEKLSEIKNISYITPSGAFYVMVNIKELMNKFNIKNSFEFAEILLKTENVVVIPGIAFGKDNYIRLSYATSSENIEKGLERIKKFVNELVCNN